MTKRKSESRNMKSIRLVFCFMVFWGLNLFSQQDDTSNPSAIPTKQTRFQFDENSFSKNIGPAVYKQACDPVNNMFIIDCHNHSLFRVSSQQESTQKQVTFPFATSGGLNDLVQCFPVGGNTNGTISENEIEKVENKSLIKEIN